MDVTREGDKGELEEKRKREKNKGKKKEKKEQQGKRLTEKGSKKKKEKKNERERKEKGEREGEKKKEKKEKDRKQENEKYLWNDKEGWYADYDLKTHKVRNQLTAAALFPLYVNAASRERATKVAAAAESRLLKPGGLTTTTVNSGQQWDAPNGWALLQGVAVEGVQNYGQKKICFLYTYPSP
ncbi:trehalase family glycosidase, partial [Stenotrophomonas maltophilia]|uniref:trehalase family glycosidase n=1 Tax=Stenotrophomonas maltophilia TaxID=40324 RepID=UPI0022521F54